MNGPLSFQESTKKDLSHLIALLQDDDLGSTREDISDLASYEKAFKFILEDPLHQILILKTGDEIIGCTQLSFLPNLTFKGGWRAQLEGVRINSKFRGQGFGKQLIREAINRSKQFGCHLVQFTTNSARPKSILFYEKLGFKSTHTGMKLYLDP